MPSWHLHISVKVKYHDVTGGGCLMRISELSSSTGVPARMLRHYEARGLLTPERDHRGWRHYTENDRDRVLRVRELVSVGIPTALALRLLQDDGDPADVLAEIAEFRDRLARRIECLKGNRDALTAWLARGGNGHLTPSARS